jgi:ABC-2 type transport system ATP-binding protein
MSRPVVIEHLVKVYTVRQRKGLFRSHKVDVHALTDISFEVAEKEIFGLLGPNGAGKTTLIKILTTLLLPTAGKVYVNGYDVTKEENRVRASVGCMLMGERGLYWKLTGRENLEYFAALYHMPPKKRKERAAEILHLLHLEEIADRTVETYSSGQKMKLAFGKALIQDAPLLVLDEPTNTLDVPSASELRAIVRQLNQEGKTILYTTHIMAEAEALCQRVAIIDQGKLLALGTPAELKESLRSARVVHIEGVISAQAVDQVRLLPAVSQATRSSTNGATVLTVVSNATDNILPDLINILIKNGATIQKVIPQEPTLEDVFIAKTGRTLAEDTRLKT